MTFHIQPREAFSLHLHRLVSCVSQCLCDSLFTGSEMDGQKERNLNINGKFAKTAPCKYFQNYLIKPVCSSTCPLLPLLPGWEAVYGLLNH